MAAPNGLTLADGLASAYGSLTPPTGYPAIRRSTARPPNAIPTFPFVTVEPPPDGEMLAMSSGADLTITYRVRFWYARHVGDQARDAAALHAWWPVLMWATASNTTLGLAPTVKSAIPTVFRFFVDEYAGTEAYGWEIDVPMILRNLAYP